MKAWTVVKINKILQGILYGEADIEASGCSLDSRQVREGQIFFALPGEKVDGHKYIASAWDKGAVLAVAEQGRLADALPPVPAGKALILVDSSFKALQELAKAWRQALGVKVIGITGSNGKTTTKDMVTAVLEQRYRVYKNQGNHNNELGLPLTILNAPADTEFLVLEMGMRGLGEITALCEIARPDTGVITNIGTTHLELLHTQENIAQAKWELIEALPPEGVAVLNAEDRFSVQKAGSDRHAVRFYGLEGLYRHPDIQGINLKPAGAMGTEFEVLGDQKKAQAHLPLPGEHNVLDALAAVAVGTIYDIPLTMCCTGLAQLQISGMRLEVLSGFAGSTLINDVYNANPVSMEASLKILKERAGHHTTLAILGEMYELGEASESGHRQVGRALAGLGITELITVGDLAANIAEGAREAGLKQENIHVTSAHEQAIDEAKKILSAFPKTWALIKGSRGMRMERVTAGLKH